MVVIYKLIIECVVTAAVDDATVISIIYSVVASTVNDLSNS